MIKRIVERNEYFCWSSILNARRRGSGPRRDATEVGRREVVAVHFEGRNPRARARRRRLPIVYHIAYALDGVLYGMVLVVLGALRELPVNKSDLLHDE